MRPNIKKIILILLLYYYSCSVVLCLYAVPRLHNRHPCLSCAIYNFVISSYPLFVAIESSIIILDYPTWLFPCVLPFRTYLLERVSSYIYCTWLIVFCLWLLVSISVLHFWIDVNTSSLLLLLLLLLLL